MFNIVYYLKHLLLMISDENSHETREAEFSVEKAVSA